MLIILLAALPLSAQVRVRSGNSRSGGTFSAGGTITPPPPCLPPNTVIDGVCTPPPVPTAENLYCGPGDAETFAATDGVADLPTACVYTAMSGSPSSGTVYPAATAGDLTTLLTTVACGDTIQLNAGTTYTGNFTLPNKACDATHWITIRTNEILNANFPPEGTRATPCEINQTSVPYYPQYSCLSPGARMPTVATNTANTPVFTTASGANHYRLIGLNLTTSSTSLSVFERLLEFRGADHIIVDRSLCHFAGAHDSGTGVAQGCLQIDETTHFAVINSWLYDFFCKTICSDAYAIGGGGGDADEGPVKVYNNLIAADAESFIWGGTGGTTAVPHDFEIRSNHSFKPLSWYLPIQGGPGPFSPNPGKGKNLGEFKNGERALIEGNVFENSFSGWQTDQFAHGFMLTPKSQGGTSPAVRVRHVTLRYNHFRRVGRGMQITITTGSGCTTPGCIPDGPPLHNISIHDNLFQDLNSFFSNNASAGTNPAVMCFEFSSSIANLPITDVSIDHNTCIAQGGNGTHAGLSWIGDSSGTSAGPSTYTNYLANFKFTNNLSPGGIVPSFSANGTAISPPKLGYAYIFSSNHGVGGGTTDQPDGSGAGTGTNTLTFAKNVLGIQLWSGQTSDCTGGQTGFASCPTSFTTTTLDCGIAGETCFPVGAAFTGLFTDYNGGHDGDYHLVPASVYKLAGTDGKDIGADLDTLNAKISGVRNPTTYDPLAISTTTLASGIVSTAYTTTLTATGGAGPYKRWALNSGSGALPTGITQKLTGILSGTPTVAGNYNYTVQVQDYARQIDTQDLSISIAPKLTSLAPTSGVVGDSVTLTGAGFGATQGTNSVSFNNGVNASSITSWSDTQIVCLVPAGTITGLVRVSINSVYSAGITFTIAAAPSPTITSLTPAFGAVASSFTIAGTNFGATQGSSTATMNGTAVTCSSWSATSLGCVVPAGATTGNVVVQVGGINSNGTTYTVGAAPALTSLNPTSGTVGTTVTLTGSGFGATQGTNSVSFSNSVTATAITSWSNTQIVCLVPAGAVTGVVRVSIAGVFTNGITFTVPPPSPNISSLAPASGVIGSGFTIAGTNFGSTQGSSTVTMNGTAVTCSTWSATSLSCLVPSATTGNVVVRVGGVNSNGVTYSVGSAPWVGIVSPTRAIDWSSAGAGSIPPRTTLCSTLSSGASLASINSAIAACPDGETVYLQEGTYTLGGMITMAANVTLRGAGANKTILTFTNDGSCRGLPTDICVSPSNNPGMPSPSNTTTWTAGYAKGDTALTLGTTSGMTVGDILILDQLDDSSDGGSIYVCASSACAGEGGNSYGRSGRAQQQLVKILTIPSSGHVTVTPALHMPNWRTGQTPGVSWADVRMTGVGIEDMSIDHTSSTGSHIGGITFLYTDTCWMKGVRSITADRSHVWFYQSMLGTVRDSYFYGNQNSASQSYGIETFSSGSLLVENNIFQHVTGPITVNGSDSGSVYGYNFAIDDNYTVSSNWMIPSFIAHEAGQGMDLFEGNEGLGLEADDIHGTHHFLSYFRNYVYGDIWNNPAKSNHTDLVHFYAFARYFNMVGNVLGRSYYNTYETNLGGSNTGIYSLGGGGGSPNNPPTDGLVKTTLFRWGNYDNVNAATRFVSGEVPTGIGTYANTVPASTTLPASFYLPSKPGFFGSLTYPPIGPDVTGGTGLAGHAYSIPAKTCYVAMGGLLVGGSAAALDFNADDCY